MPLIIVKSDKKAREKPCLRCGYSLRKLMDSRFCPECGLSIWLSLNSNDDLHGSNPDWLRKLFFGTCILIVAQVLGLAAYALYFAAFELDIPPWWLKPAYLAASISIYLAAYHVGLLMLASYEGRHPDRLYSHRMACWIISAIALLTAGLMLLGAARPSSLHRFLGWTYFIEMIVLASAIITWLFYRRLARRIPSSALSRTCGYLLLAPLLPALKVFPWFGYIIFSTFGWLFAFIPWIYFPFTIVLLSLFAARFHRAIADAEQHWAAETMPHP